jgi:GT2 family glycosyltransferase
LESLKQLTGSFGDNDVYLIDNTEINERTVEYYLKNKKLVLPENIRLLKNPGNPGFAAAVNLGMKTAFKAGFIWVTVLNDDVKFKRDAIDKYVKNLDGSIPGISGIYPGDIDPVRYSTIFPAAKKSKFKYFSGSFWSIHKNIPAKIGYLDERYFLYYEEVDYCFRAAAEGFSLTCQTAADINHSDSPRLGKNSFLHQYYLARNHLIFVFKMAPLTIKLHEYFRIPLTFIEHIQKGEWGAVSGVLDFIRGKSGRYEGAI